MHRTFGAFAAACGATLWRDAVASTDLIGSTNKISMIYNTIFALVLSLDKPKLLMGVCSYL